MTGVALALVSALSFAVTNVLMRKVLRRVALDQATFVVIVLSTLALGFPFAVQVVSESFPEVPLFAWLWFCASGILGLGLGSVTLFASIRHIGAARAGAIKNVAPVVSVSAAIWLLGERPTILGAAGMTTVGIGLYVLVHETFRETRRSEGPGNAPRDRQVRRGDRLAEQGVFAAGAAVPPPFMRPRTAGTLLGILSAVFLGGSQALRKAGIQHMGDALLGAFIASVSALVAYSGSLLARRRFGTVVRRASTSFPRDLWLAGGTAGLGLVAFFAAVAMVPVSYVSVVASSEALFTLTLSAGLSRYREVVTGGVWVAASLIMIGAVLMALA
ncbi:MAG: EamA family transporter [Actinomycetota bacterium]